MQLKQYQADTLSVLRRFFEEARIAGPKNAYEAITQEPEQAARLRGYAESYAPLKELPDVPYVCLRLPTGGGKTILAAHAVSIARNAWIEKDYPLVLWLVPTKTIRRQTVEALKNTPPCVSANAGRRFRWPGARIRHRRLYHIRPHDLRDHCCIVVGTIQTLRVSNTEGRKVYAHNEEMEPHFSGVRDTAPGLEKLDNNTVKFSFANLLHRHQPLMIVDEAHNAVTGLTREMQARVNPCAIVEFTATPQRKSNILYSVTAQELKREEMIKLPIMLAEHDTWQNAVTGAITARASLAKTAKDDADYIRPIVLFQAQPRNQEVTVAALKNHLIDIEQISRKQNRHRHRRPARTRRHRLIRPHLSHRYVITVRSAQRRMGLLLCLHLLLGNRASKARPTSSNYSARVLANAPTPSAAQQPTSTKPTPSSRAIFWRGRPRLGRQIGRYGL